MPRPKFYRNHGPCQLRVEQIGPHLWHGAVYEARPFLVTVRDEATGDVIKSELHQFDSWERFTCLDEACAKRCAIATVDNRLADRRVDPPASPSHWSDDSTQPDENWKAELERLHFPGYFERDGVERFENL